MPEIRQVSPIRHPPVSVPPDGSVTIKAMLEEALVGEEAIVEHDDPGSNLAVSVAVLDGARIVTVGVEGALDGPTGRALVHVGETVVSEGADRLDLDLRLLASYTIDGASALVRCREMCAVLPQGLHYRTGAGPGREALLAAYEQDR